MSPQKNDNLLKVIQSEIIKGYSKYKFGNEYLYVKHIDIFLSSKLDEYYNESLAKALEMGAKTREDRIKEVYSQKLWTQKKEQEIEEKKSYLERLKTTKKKMHLKSEADYIKMQIEIQERELKELEKEKEDIIGGTAENFAEKKVNDIFFYLSSFKDEYLNINFFSEQDYEELESTSLNELFKIFEIHSKKINSENIKKISLSPSFLNYFYLCDDNPVSFFGKPVCNLTFYQLEVFSNAKYYKQILIESNSNIPEDIKQNPDKLIEWFEINKNAQKMISQYDNSDDSNLSLVGATKEDLQHIGLSHLTPSKSNLAEEAAKKGGVLTMEDLIRLNKL